MEWHGPFHGILDSGAMTKKVSSVSKLYIRFLGFAGQWTSTEGIICLQNARCG